MAQAWPRAQSSGSTARRGSASSSRRAAAPTSSPTTPTSPPRVTASCRKARRWSSMSPRARRARRRRTSAPSDPAASVRSGFSPGGPGLSLWTGHMAVTERTSTPMARSWPAIMRPMVINAGAASRTGLMRSGSRAGPAGSVVWSLRVAPRTPHDRRRRPRRVRSVGRSRPRTTTGRNTPTGPAPVVSLLRLLLTDQRSTGRSSRERPRGRFTEEVPCGVAEFDQHYASLLP
jgi:hypothetical protein